MTDLQRFLDAQAPVYEHVLAELKAGQKRTHWMWFVLPQLQGLGRSPTARFYGIAGLDEARAYAAHPVLGARLVECVRTVLGVPSKTAHQIFGSPDDLKFRSCLTLFELVSSERCFAQALERFYGSCRDEGTLLIVQRLSA